MNLFNISLTIETDTKIGSLKKTIQIYKKYIRRLKKNQIKYLQKQMDKFELAQEEIKKLKKKTFLPLGTYYMDGRGLKGLNRRKFRSLSLSDLQMYDRKPDYLLRRDGWDKKKIYNLIKNMLNFSDFKILYAWNEPWSFPNIKIFIYSNKFKEFEKYAEREQIPTLLLRCELKTTFNHVEEVYKIDESELE